MLLIDAWFHAVFVYLPLSMVILHCQTEHGSPDTVCSNHAKLPVGSCMYGKYTHVCWSTKLHYGGV